MGESDDGDDSAALVQTRRPDSRVHGADQDIVALIVPGGPGPEAQFDPIGLRAPHLAGPVRSIGEPKRLKGQAAEVGPRRLTGGRAPGRAPPTDVGGARPT